MLLSLGLCRQRFLSNHSDITLSQSRHFPEDYRGAFLLTQPPSIAEAIKEVLRRGSRCLPALLTRGLGAGLFIWSGALIRVV